MQQDPALPSRITRDIELELSADELWELISEAEGWSAWLVDEAELDVQPGGRGTVLEAGVERDVVIDEVAPGESVRFRWWPTDRPEQGSAVELEILELGQPSDTNGPDRTTGVRVLRIIETAQPAAARASVATAWELRATMLAVRTLRCVAA